MSGPRLSCVHEFSPPYVLSKDTIVTLIEGLWEIILNGFNFDIPVIARFIVFIYKFSK